MNIIDLDVRERSVFGVRIFRKRRGNCKYVTVAGKKACSAASYWTSIRVGGHWVFGNRTANPKNDSLREKDQ
uniref:Uncharacterized protein n=1 Tax=Romanomermis culicivorax TaxID=13658 RepID=A0A915IBW0_ROMCU